MTGEGFPDFIAALTARCRSARQALDPPSTAPNIRHRHALDRVARHLDTAADHARSGDGFIDQMGIELGAALTALGEITGQTATEEILERIFNRFCVGK